MMLKHAIEKNIKKKLSGRPLIIHNRHHQNCVLQIIIIILALSKHFWSFNVFDAFSLFLE